MRNICITSLISFLQVSVDPFLEKEPDPLKTNALESSLWELETLQQHVLPSVSKAVSFINKPLPNTEWDLTSLIETTYEQVSYYVAYIYTEMYFIKSNYYYAF